MQLIRHYKRTFMYVTLCLVLGLFVGYVLHLKIEKETIRSNVKTLIFEGLDRSELVFISIEREKDPSFEWKDDREFSLNGHFYDIVEYTVGEVQKGYWCWLDEEESEVEEKINHLFKLKFKDNPHEKKRELVYQSFLQSLYFEPVELLISFQCASIQLKINSRINPLSDPTSSPPCPPPELC